MCPSEKDLFKAAAAEKKTAGAIAHIAGKLLGEDIALAYGSAMTSINAVPIIPAAKKSSAAPFLSLYTLAGSPFSRYLLIR